MQYFHANSSAVLPSGFSVPIEANHDAASQCAFEHALPRNCEGI
jgi:hypothetical protein